MDYTASRPRRVVFCSRPGFGHVYPMLPLATEVRDAGHDVVFATGEDALPSLASLGFRTQRVGISIREGFAELLGDSPMPSMEEREGQEVARRVFSEVLPRTPLAIYGHCVTSSRPT